MIHREFKCSETFPVAVGDRWTVTDGRGRPVERWEVIHRWSLQGQRYFTAAIAEVPLSHLSGFGGREWRT